MRLTQASVGEDISLGQICIDLGLVLLHGGRHWRAEVARQNAIHTDACGSATEILIHRSLSIQVRHRCVAKLPHWREHPQLAVHHIFSATILTMLGDTSRTMKTHYEAIHDGEAQ